MKANLPSDSEYDGTKDFAESILACFEVVRERTRNGGEPWVPAEPKFRFPAAFSRDAG